MPLTTTLQGQVSDDGFPNGILTQQWTQISGPATAIFSDPTQSVTDVSLPDYGVYTFRLTATDGELEAFDEVVITYEAQGTNYYVSKTGNDSNPGTSAQPKLTIAAGIGLLSGWDTLQIGAGIYAEALDNII